MLGASERVSDPNKVVHFLRTATLEQAFLDVTVMPSKRRYNAYFLCVNGNLGRRDAIFLSLPEGDNTGRIFDDATSVNISFQLDGSLVDVPSNFVGIGKKGDHVCAELTYPDLVSLKKIRQFMRVQVPQHVDIAMEVRQRNKPPFSARVFDLAMGGLSFSYRVRSYMEGGAAAMEHRLKAEDFVKMEIHVPDGAAAYDIPVNGVVRRVSRLRREDGSLEEVVGVEIMMISMGLKNKFNELIDLLEKEGRLVRQGRAGLSMKDMAIECDHERGAMEDEAPEVYAAIRDGDVAAMVALINEWHANPQVSADLAAGLAEHGNSHTILTAFKTLFGIGQSESTDRLFEALMERRHFNTLMELMQILPENSPYAEKLAQGLVGHFPSDKLIEAVSRTRNKPTIQSILIEAMATTGTVDDFVESLSHLRDNLDATVKLAHRISDRSQSSDDLVRVIATVRGALKGEASDQALDILVKKFTRVASEPALLSVLERHISDHSLAGEFLVSEIVHRGRPEDMIKAFRQMTMDSMSSLFLALGLVRTGSLDQIRKALALSRTCPRAKLVLGGEMLRFQEQNRKGGLALFSKLSDGNRKEMMRRSAQLIKEAEAEFDKVRLRLEEADPVVGGQSDEEEAQL
ncbi:MAG: hypothetical protein HQL50_15925 [Magnetococcales bacterium]|nr:hypothetical protein [Magnetococcales bacterium]